MTNSGDLKYLNVEELQPAAEGAEDTPGSKTAAAKQVKRGSRKVADTSTSVGHGASRTASDVTHATAERVKTGSRTAWDATTSVATTLMSTTQSLLTLRLSEGLNELIQNLVKGSESIYDKAMVAEDLAAQAGSNAYHRLFDGGHTILGAGRAAGGASPEDSIVREGLGTVQGLLRGVTPIRGLPLANWDNATFDRVAGALESGFNIPKGWFYDLNTYDAAELLGGAVGAVALTFSWNRAQTATFARLVGGMGLSAAISANPLLLIVTVVSPGQGLPQGARDRRVRRADRRPAQGWCWRGSDAVGGRASRCREWAGGRCAAGRSHSGHTCQQGDEKSERDPDQPLPGRENNCCCSRSEDDDSSGEWGLLRLCVPGPSRTPASS